VRTHLGREKVGRGVTGGGSDGRQRLDETVALGRRVVVGRPHRLAIGWVLAPAKALLLAVVEDGDPIRDKGVGHGVGDERLVAHERGQPDLVVALGEAAEETRVLHRRLELVVHRGERGDRAVGRAKGCEDLEVGLRKRRGDGQDARGRQAGR